jgi:hypothetical protein
MGRKPLQTVTPFRLAPKLHWAARLQKSEGGVELVGAPHAALA